MSLLFLSYFIFFESFSLQLRDILNQMYCTDVRLAAFISFRMWNTYLKEHEMSCLILLKCCALLTINWLDEDVICILFFKILLLLYKMSVSAYMDCVIFLYTYYLSILFEARLYTCQ